MRARSPYSAGEREISLGPRPAKGPGRHPAPLVDRVFELLWQIDRRDGDVARVVVNYA
jgi:hypothetical protein